MNSEPVPVSWSVEKQRSLEASLVGVWADDIWKFTPANPKRHPHYMRFTLNSPSLKTEIKYAIWTKFDTGESHIHSDQSELCWTVSGLIDWLNHSTSPIQSLMEKALEEWEMSLRNYLIQTGRLRNKKIRALSATQEYVEYTAEDRHICLLRQLYTTIHATYDDRSETERDIWDMRKMGLAVNLVGGDRCLNFTNIVQPWLRGLTKEFMRYNMAINSPGDCCLKLYSIRKFSEFLTERDPEALLATSDIDRALIVQFIRFLNERKTSNTSKLKLLSNLRIFLETCAHSLAVEGISRERFIFNEDFPKMPPPQSREIPEGVLAQLREYLNTLSTTILRMVVILLECGLRISELCSLPLNCLTCDDKQHWSLHFYQIKPKQEQIIPLVDETVVQTIQAQQQSISEHWGTESPYLFPSIKSPLLPFKSNTFTANLNRWAYNHDIRDSKGHLYRFQTHQFRHTVGMRLINDDVPIDVISRLLGHRSLMMTQIYARKRDEQVTEDIERAGRKRKTVNNQGQIVRGDQRANAPDIQMLRKGIRGLTLPVGGCGRLIVLGDCEHANKCLTCPSWLTSTEDLPGLRAFFSKAIHIRQRALEKGNTIVLQNQDKIIPLLSSRINSLETGSNDDAYSRDELLNHLRTDLAGTGAGIEEAREAGFIRALKLLERRIDEIKARILRLEES